jgi:hypothetical protein
MAELQEVTFTDLLQHPTETVEKLHAARGRALRVHRRGDNDDLILTTVARANEESEVLEVAARVLRAVMSNPVLRSTQLLDILPQVFPWIRFLPDEDRLVFAQELIDVMDASNDLNTPTPIVQLITEWRHTAEIYTDPELLATLRAGVTTDLGEAPEPTPPVT